MKNVQVSSFAERDVESVIEWYRNESSEAADRFVDEFRKALGRISQFPKGWTQIARGYRKYSMDKFPFALIYHTRSNSDLITVIAVSHHSRRPNWWRSRTRPAP